ncbi:DUF885 domain-containing protein [Flavobacteriaceae bacterium]|jgi:hypothetical protein|nr:DUF885 domain-containing protein [Flavobacteriaceae bacterium]
MLNFLQNQKLIYFNLFILISFLVFGISNAQRYGQFQNPELVSLFKDWRAFEVPPMKNGVPDYSEASFNQRWETYTVLRERLEKFNKETWEAEQQVDWHLLWAEMNGYVFNAKILKPWQRDPAFYKSIWTSKSDVPAHEGPTHHFVIELWQYNFPLNQKRRNDLISSLKMIPELNNQAQFNLTGNAKDLWIAGIRDIQDQVEVLKDILLKPDVNGDRILVSEINKAIASTQYFVNWLKEEAPKKNGPSGIGKENYTWYQQNVHLVPLSWDDEVLLLKRELARAWSSLKLEEHRNRNLVEINPADSPEAYAILAQNAAKELINFLDQNDIVTVKDYFSKALEPHLGKYIPSEKRNFFWITAHLDPKPLFSHFYHWFELERMLEEPHPNPIRRGALLYNIFDSRNEGLATGVEEMFMHVGLYDQNPRAREIVYILIAQRAARGLGSLYAHANMLSMEEAGKIHSEYTPRGWMKTEKELLIFEQHLYLRQPGYGTSYITGKYLIEDMMMEFANKQKEDFTLKQFFDTLNSIGNIPVSLGKWEMTGDGSQIQKIQNSFKTIDY